METCEKKWMEEDVLIQSGLMKIVHRYSVISFGQIMKYGIYPGQVPVLMLLSRKEGLSQIEISKELNIKPSTVAVSMKRMEKSGLIIRKADEKDQRIQRIYVTKKLKDIQHKLLELIHNNEKIMMKGFTESEICLMSRFFDQIYENLEQIAAPDVKDLKGKRGGARP